MLRAESQYGQGRVNLRVTAELVLPIHSAQKLVIGY